MRNAVNPIVGKVSQYNTQYNIKLEECDKTAASRRGGYFCNVHGKDYGRGSDGLTSGITAESKGIQIDDGSTAHCGNKADKSHNFQCL